MDLYTILTKSFLGTELACLIIDEDQHIFISKSGALLRCHLVHFYFVIDTSKQRRIDELLNLLNDGDTLLVTELSRLGRSTTEVITLVNSLAHRSIRVIVLKQNLDIVSVE